MNGRSSDRQAIVFEMVASRNYELTVRPERVSELFTIFFSRHRETMVPGVENIYLRELRSRGTSLGIEFDRKNPWILAVSREYGIYPLNVGQSSDELTRPARLTG